MARSSGTRSLGPSAGGTNTSGSGNTGGSGSVTVGGSNTNSNIIISSPNGGSINLVTTGTINVTSTNSQFISKGQHNVGSFATTLGNDYIGGQLTLDNGTVVTIDGYDLPVGANPAVDPYLFSTTAQRKEASAYFAGGVGIEQDLSVGGFIYGRIAQSNTATTSSQLIVLSTNSDKNFYITFTDILNSSGRPLWGDNSSTYVFSSSTGWFIILTTENYLRIEYTLRQQTLPIQLAQAP
jgi:hypothetical protein